MLCTSALITQTKLAFISIPVLLICVMIHTWQLCQCYSLSTACSRVDDRCVWVAVPGFIGMRHILIHWSLLRIIEAACLVPQHCSSSFPHIVSLMCQQPACLARGIYSFLPHLPLTKEIACLHRKERKELCACSRLKVHTNQIYLYWFDLIHLLCKSISDPSKPAITHRSIPKLLAKSLLIHAPLKGFYGPLSIMKLFYPSGRYPLQLILPYLLNLVESIRRQDDLGGSLSVGKMNSVPWLLEQMMYCVCSLRLHRSLIFPLVCLDLLFCEAVAIMSGRIQGCSSLISDSNISNIFIIRLLLKRGWLGRFYFIIFRLLIIFYRHLSFVSRFPSVFCMDKFPRCPASSATPCYLTQILIHADTFRTH